MEVRDLKWQKFGRLLVLEQTSCRKNGSVVWKCKCDCGNEVLVPSGRLTSGRTRSCGCLAKETASKTAKTGRNRRIHGMKGSKIYHLWESMKYRCNNSNYPRYKDYGGRGIKVCDEWNNNFQSFYDHVSQLPHFGEDGYSIDRINNDGNYEPGNVKWSTRTEQNRNRRNVKKSSCNA